MKIIFITREGYELPGARIRCYNFAKELIKSRIDAEVLSFSDTLGAKDGKEELEMGLREKMYFNYKALKRLVKEKEAIFCLQRFNYHSFAPYLVHLLKRNKIILDLDDWEMRENPKYYFRIYPSSKAHYLTKHIARRSIFCIAASRFLEKFLLQFNKKVHYIPSGVDTELFRPSLNSLKEDKIIFSWIGTLHRKEYIENIGFALNCFYQLRKKYSHIYFDIIGNGIYRNDLEKILYQYNDQNISFKGWLNPESIPIYLATIHIGLLPVASDTKFNKAKSPTKLFEYMAMAKPTVSSNIGESLHIIKDGDNGFMVNTKEEFINKMQRLIENSNLCRQMGEKARKTIEENYSLKVLGKRLYEIINQI